MSVSDVEAPAADPPEEEDQATPSPEYASGNRTVWSGAFSFFGSLVFHLVLLVALAAWVFSQTQTELPATLELGIATEERLPQTIEIQTQVQQRQQVSQALFSVSGLPGLAGAAAGSGEAPALDQQALDAAARPVEVKLEDPLQGAPSVSKLIEATPDEALGEPRAVVDSYDEAMDRITQETQWMLSKSNVLLIWCFDQSESMKDDQEEIRARVRKVYADLGFRRGENTESLTSAVTSFGQSFLVHTKKPTSNLDLIEQAIDSVPIDKSGTEMMCPAVAASIERYQKYADGSRRRVALVLVTDESGERASNTQMLEQAIGLARSVKCRVFVLGREAVFGYPYAHMKWRHPFTGHVHHLPIDRGPETGFVEQLQTECFRKRTDAHPSGFGPYEQTRLAKETGGVFFMLPSLETNLYRGEKRRYELEQMRRYRVDLRPRGALMAERDQSLLRLTITKVIHDLDPYRPQVAEVMELPFHFPPQPARFVVASRRAQAKATVYLDYLLRAERTLIELRRYRDQDPSPRWQANYDLMFAQTLAYIARTYEYGAYLEQFIANPKQVPLEKPKFLRLARWDLRESSATVGGDTSADYIQRAGEAFEQIIYDHPGTPWAARAKWELQRGFGVELFPHYGYYGPRSPTPTRTIPNIPIPKL